MKNIRKLSISSLGAVALTLTSILPTNAQTLQAKTLQNLNLRTGPGTNYSIISTIKKGMVVEIMENTNAWSLVKYNGTVGYVSSNYLKEISSNGPSSSEQNSSSDSLDLMECNINYLNVRKGPSTSESILGKLDKSDRVYVVYQTSNGWTRIKYASGYGYVSSKYLIKIDENSQTNDNLIMQCKVNSLNIRKGPSPSEPIVGGLKSGDKVNVVMNLNNGWSKIKFNGEYAYVNTAYLSKSVDTPKDPAFMKCNTNILNIRNGPSTSEKIIGKLKIGEKVEVVYHLNSGWARIKINNSYGYVNSLYLK